MLYLDIANKKIKYLTCSIHGSFCSLTMYSDLILNISYSKFIKNKQLQFQFTITIFNCNISYCYLVPLMEK